MNIRPPVRSLGTWKTNGEMIAEIAEYDELGYLPVDGAIWDATHGPGTFWTVIRPAGLVATDLDPAKSPDTPAGLGLDATQLPEAWLARFDTVVCDPDYKLNGTDQGEGERYGVAGPYKSAADRLGSMGALFRSCSRAVKPGGHFLFKCQDQTNGGRRRWQAREFADLGEGLGFDLVDLFLYPSYRPQPARSTCIICDTKIMRRKTGQWGDNVRAEGHDQFACVGWLYTGRPGHAPDPDAPVQDRSHVNYSTLLVFQKPTVTAQG